MDIGIKIAQARREQGITQIELADQLSVTRQTVSRWETGAAFPDIETVASLAEILQVSCDYLLRDLPSERNVVPATDNTEAPEHGSSITKLLSSIEGKNVRISFYDDEEDMDVWDKVCKVDCFEGNWIRVTIQQESETQKKLFALSSILSQEGETHKKLIALSSILSFEIVEQEENQNGSSL